MANICNTTIKLIMDEENATKLKSLLMDEDLQRYGSDVSVSTIYKEFGIKPNKYTHLRASWYGYEEDRLDDGRVVVSVIEDAAWNPTQLVLQLEEEGFVDDFYFYSEEPGNCIFCTNDEDGVYFPQRWYVYISDSGENELFTDFDDALEYVNKETNRRYKTLKEIDESEDVFIHQIEIVDKTEI